MFYYAGYSAVMPQLTHLVLMVRDESALASGNEALGEIKNRHNVAHRSNGKQYYKILLHNYTSAPLLDPPASRCREQAISTHSVLQWPIAFGHFRILRDREGM